MHLSIVHVTAAPVTKLQRAVTHNGGNNRQWWKKITPYERNTYFVPMKY